jgi:putative heme-binding domain-containing protein
MPTDFTVMTPKQIAEELGHPNLTRRHLALREVKTRGTKEWLPEFTSILETKDTYQPMGDRVPIDFVSKNPTPRDFRHQGVWLRQSDMRSAFTLWALSYLGERLAVSCVMREGQSGGSWTEDRRDKANLVIPDRLFGLVLSHCAQIIGCYEKLHPWEKWNLGTAFDFRGSAVGRAVAQSLVHRPDFIDDDLRWQSRTVERLTELIHAVSHPDEPNDINPKHLPDPSYEHSMKLLLRDWLSRPTVFTNVMSGYFRGDKISRQPWFIDVLTAVPSADVSRWLLTNHHKSTAALKQIAAYGDDQTVRAAYSTHPADLTAMHEGFQATNRKLPAEFLQVCTIAAEQLLKRNVNTDWVSLNLNGKPSNINPWCLDERKDADGQTIQVISSLDKTQKDPEMITGILRSKPFTAPAKLSFWLCGHQGFPKGPPHHKNLVRLMLNGNNVRTAYAPRKDECQRIEWNLEDIQGQQVTLEVVDGDNGKSYAWLGVGRFEPAVLDTATFTSAQTIRKQLTTLASILKTTAPVALRDKLAPYLPKPAVATVPAKPRPELEAIIQQRVTAFSKAKPEAAKGEQVFTTHCAACHQVKGKGGIIGPQLDGIGSRGVARVMEDILDPWRNIDAHFQLHQITLKDGTITSGSVRNETAQNLVLADAAGTENRLLKADITEDKALPASLMPPAFAEVIKEGEFHQLVAWLLKN